MNFFLHINRKLIFYTGLLLAFSFLIFIFLKQINLSNFYFNNSKESFPEADISKPKFAINNEKKKIYITASEGNFINKDEILLKDNVKFKSNEFSIETDKVVFNRNEQTARSNTKSLFKSKNTTISSDGFNIHDKGNKIIFYGNSYIVLK